MSHIRQYDVFISWTGKDRDLKDRIVTYLRENKIEVLESDYACAGDFREWSRDAVSKCTVFLSLYTENTVHSQWVPVEIEELQKLDDWCNRCVPVVSDYELYAAHCPMLAESESAVVIGGRELTDKHLEKILFNVQNLINKRLFNIYREATKPTYLKLKSFLRLAHIQDREFDYETLYIPRAVIDEDGNAVDNAAAFTNTEDIVFLQGPAGSGKSCYIDQLRGAADDNTLVMALACRKLATVTDLFSAMFEEFRRHCGNRHFYTAEDFKSLLSERHLLLVLDGMDEIATKHGTRQFLGAVKEYYSANADSTTLFFTSRNEADADLIAMNGQAPKRLTLRSLEEDQIKAFGDNLFLLLNKPDKSDEFYVSVQALADEIRTNPLLLSQLAIVYASTDQIPQTTVGIYDAVCEITLKHEEDIAAIPESYREMVTMKLPTILKKFSAERYRLAQEEDYTTEEVMAIVLEDMGYPEPAEQAAFLLDYLKNRAILIEDEFYHKMLLEYFTAVEYYEEIFDLRKTIKNADVLKDLFSHYADPYWSAVLQLFLVKADSLIGGKTTTALYTELMTFGITEYTLLFDTCRDLICHKEEAQCALLRDILRKSVDGTYPPYGPLFWYVPEYELYEPLLLALDGMTDEPCFTKALALTRDVCWIFGQYNTAAEITDRVNGEALFVTADFGGVRRGLCELFFTGDTAASDSEDIYPRCFNIAEAQSWKDCGQGVFGRMSTAFEDELGLYSHEMFSELGGEYIGIVAAPYDKERLETVLPQKSCKKMCGLFFSPTKKTKYTRLAINDRRLKRGYIPENTTEFWLHGDEKNILNLFVDNAGILYFYNTVCLPIGVTEIGSGAFFGCSVLTSITIPDSVTEIGWGAFYGCSALTSIILPDSVTIIGFDAFKDCSALVSITLPDSMVTIGGDIFCGCASLKRIFNFPPGYTAEYWGSPKDCMIEMRSLKKGEDVLIIPDGITVITKEDIPNRQVLRSVVLPSSVTKIEEGAFKNCRALTSIIIPDSVTEIGWGAFYGCSALIHITIPNSVTKINMYSFWECNALISITLPKSLEIIGYSAFCGCSSLASITLPNSLTIIGGGAFCGCNSLEAILLPDSLMLIEDEAFCNCRTLASIIIPGCVVDIGRHAFKGCISLKKIYNCPPGHTIEDLGVPDDCVIEMRSLKEEEDILKIRDGIIVVNREDIPNRRTWRSVILPNSVTIIGEGTFKDCEALTSITLPNSVTEIKKAAFERCGALASIAFSNSITTIGDYAFEGCGVLTSITLPNSVTEIGSSAFLGCSALVSIILPDSVSRIRESAFEDCSSVMSITLPNTVTEIESRTFYGCSALSAITIPDSVTEIGWGAFCGCGALKLITLPNTVTRIRWHAFSDCSALASINIPDGVSEIGWGTFEGCGSLVSITIPDSVTEIGERAFKSCTNLTSINIPISIKKIYDDAFADCTGLKEITISRRFEDDLERIFSGVDLSQVTIHWI